MDEYTRTLHDAVDAAAMGDPQALYIARWLLQGLVARQHVSEAQPEGGS
ncbi:hypothetical protein [Lysobacter xanthus]